MKQIAPITFALFILTLSAAATAAQDSATAHLEAFFHGLKTLQVEFQQTVKDSDGGILQETSGTLALQRPNRFRWDYLAPYRQVIVTDGDKLWLYDEDLEQVTVKDFSAIGGTPATLLSSERPLAESFETRELPPAEGLLRVELLPRSPDSGFEKIRLGFSEKGLALMELVDSFGQTSAIHFHHLQRNIPIDPRLFTFQAPPGVDIVYDRGP
ncbi:MAG: outer membrane lipoprotein chaperone LolA [Gammaproteobacteria bacterium]